FPAGLYIVGGTITVSKPLTLLGYGATLSSSVGGITILRITSGDVNVLGLTVAGPGGSYIANSIGIATIGSSPDAVGDVATAATLRGVVWGILILGVSRADANVLGLTVAGPGGSHIANSSGIAIIGSSADAVGDVATAGTRDSEPEDVDVARGDAQDRDAADAGRQRRPVAEDRQRLVDGDGSTDDVEPGRDQDCAAGGRVVDRRLDGRCAVGDAVAHGAEVGDVDHDLALAHESGVDGLLDRLGECAHLIRSVRRIEGFGVRQAEQRRRRH